MAEPLRVNIGCGHGRIPEWVNCDLFPGQTVDEVFDCQEKWPFQDNTVQDVVASHVLEHLARPKDFFREAWRVLVPNGRVAIRVPYGGHRAAWWDLEHQRPWYAENFAFLQPGYAQCVGNPQHDDWQWPFCVEMVDFRIANFIGPYLRRRWLRRLLVKWVDTVPDWCEELYVYLFALKTPEALAAFSSTRSGQTIPARYVVYRHHLEGRFKRQGETSELVPVAELETFNGYF